MINEKYVSSQLKATGGGKCPFKIIYILSNAMLLLVVLLSTLKSYMTSTSAHKVLLIIGLFLLSMQNMINDKYVSTQLKVRLSNRGREMSFQHYLHPVQCYASFGGLVVNLEVLLDIHLRPQSSFNHWSFLMQNT